MLSRGTVHVDSDDPDVTGEVDVVLRDLTIRDPYLPTRAPVLVANEEGPGIGRRRAKSSHVLGETELTDMHAHAGGNGAFLEDLTAQLVKKTEKRVALHFLDVGRVPRVKVWLSRAEILEDVGNRSSEYDDVAESWESALRTTPIEIFEASPGGGKNACSVGDDSRGRLWLCH